MPISLGSLKTSSVEEVKLDDLPPVATVIVKGYRCSRCIGDIRKILSINSSENTRFSPNANTMEGWRGA